MSNHPNRSIETRAKRDRFYKIWSELFPYATHHFHPSCFWRDFQEWPLVNQKQFMDTLERTLNDKRILEDDANAN